MSNLPAMACNMVKAKKAANIRQKVILLKMVEGFKHSQRDLNKYAKHYVAPCFILNVTLQ